MLDTTHIMMTQPNSPGRASLDFDTPGDKEKREPGEPRASDESIRIRMITHNIRYAPQSLVKGEGLWRVRCPHVCSALIFNSIEPETFICLQEVLHSQLLDIREYLNESSDIAGSWDYIGVGRENGKTAGEYCPIFYRPFVWRLRGWKTYWLSETPKVPSRGWDAACIRIVTIGEFEHRKTGRKIIAMNTHLDHVGVKARQESAELILKWIKEYGEVKSPETILLAGDFNSPPNDSAYRIMTSAESSMEDIGQKVPKGKRHGNEMTFTSFTLSEKQLQLIDFLFSRKGDKLKFDTYAVLANRFDDGVFSSDHRACVADVQLLSR